MSDNSASTNFDIEVNDKCVSKTDDALLIFYMFCIFGYTVLGPNTLFGGELLAGLPLFVLPIVFFRKRFKKSIVYIPVILWILTILLSALLCKYGIKSGIKGLEKAWLIFLFFGLVNAPENMKKYRVLIIHLFVVGCLFAFVVTLIQFLTGEDIFRPNAEALPFIESVGYRARGPFSNPLTSAGYFCLLSTFFISFLFEPKAIKVRMKILLFVGILLSFAIIFMCFSRLYFVAFFLGFLFILSMKSFKGLLISWIVFSICMALILLIPRNNFEENYHSIEFYPKKIYDSSEKPIYINTLKITSHYSEINRIREWYIALKTWTENKIFGCGPGPDCYFAETEQLRVETKCFKKLHAHNVCLQVLAETGIVGFAFFGLMWIIIIYVLFKKFRHIIINCREKTKILKSVEEKLIAQDRAFFHGILGMLFVLFFAGLFENNFLDVEIQILIWFFLAMALWGASMKSLIGNPEK